MPERSFGRTIRYRRTKAGLSQAKLGDLVGRSASTIRSWEKDDSVPNDPEVIQALAAVLGIDPRMLYEKSGTEAPAHETSPTVEEALASLRPPTHESREPVPEIDTALTMSQAPPAEPPTPEPIAAPAATQFTPPPPPPTPPPPATPSPASRTVEAGFVTPKSGLLVTPPTPPVYEQSYIEDASQRQLYRVRVLATVVLMVALAVVFVWALSNAVDALGTWWDDFFGGLRL